jgi:hypothetical protein
MAMAVRFAEMAGARALKDPVQSLAELASNVTFYISK